MEDKLVNIATFAKSEDAHLARILLSESNIKSVVLGENLLMVIPKVGLPGVELHVPQSQAKKAVEILESQRNQEKRSL